MPSAKEPSREASETSDKTTHRFERAGLGKAPFRCVGSFESKYQAIPGDPSCPVQPGASCDYCGQGIYQVYQIRSADGREFRVGSDCVVKTGDAGLRRLVDKDRAAKRKAQACAREQRVIAEAAAQLERPEVVAALSVKQTDNRGVTESYLEFLARIIPWCGRAGRVRYAKRLIEAAKEVPNV